MKRIKLFSVFLFFAFSIVAFSQTMNPVTWNITHKQLSNNTLEITATATIADGWHLYGTLLPNGGPIATSLRITSKEFIESEVAVVEKTLATKKFDTTFNMELSYFSNNATLVKTLILANNASLIKGEIEFMACNDESCTPPDIYKFEIPIDNKELISSSQKNTGVKITEAPRGYLSIFLLAFLGGLAALLTPCVFPMIPMTVSFFIKQSKSKATGITNALIFGLSIIVLYVFLGTAVTFAFGADALNILATNPWFNLFFFALLTIFAISFFGAFDIVLPSKWVNAADKNADRGGVLGIIFMALTLALVSFSCTGPIVGTLIVQAANSGGLAPIIGMLGFSLAIAIPFTFFAAFPGYLNSLPKSGGWLNSVKVVLGFLELAFAFKFLSIADMVLDLHLLEREVFIAVWVAIFGALGFYLLGKIRLPHDSPIDRLPVSRLMTGLLVIAFTLYMIPGIWGAPVKLISGFPPPREYSEIQQTPFPQNNLRSENDTLKIGNTYIGAQGLETFDDYDTALKYAKKVNKPLLIDFTGKGCVNCRKMEENVWSNSEIRTLIAEKYVLVSLYVDLRTDLPKEKQYISPKTGKEIITIGNKWSDFQISKFERNSQPFYVIFNAKEEEIIPSRAYNLSIEEYKAWLLAGIDGFYKR